MKAFRVIVLGVALPMLAASCTSPVADRIRDDPGAFAALSARERLLVERGEITRGMSRAAVRLAWGEPDRRGAETLRGTSCEKWTYRGYVPADGFAVQYDGPGRGAGTTLVRQLLVADRDQGTYVPYPVREAYFAGGKLLAWDVAR